jgi:sugar phosphate isomerase/epimerase
MKRIILFSIMMLFVPTFMMAQQRYRVAACDWMMLKRQKLGEFQLSKTIGADGVELDMGGLGRRDSFDNKLRQPEQQLMFKHTADSLGIEIAAVAMSGLYAQNFSMKTSYRWLVEDCLNTMQSMGATVAFLPLGGCGNNWTDSLPQRKEIVKRLHEVGEMARARGMVLGIDTPLDAKGNKKLLKEINSDGIKIFYKFQTIIEHGWNLCADMKSLGKKNICAIHASNVDQYLLKDDPAINMSQVKATLDKMGWGGWLIVERSRDVKQVHNVKYNYGENVKYLKEIFQQ